MLARPVPPPQFLPFAQSWRTRILAAVRRRPAAVVFAGYLLLAIAVLSNAWRSPFTRVPAWDISLGNTWDGPLTIWFLRWFPFAIGHGQTPLVTNYVDYPLGANMMWQNAVPVLAAALAPVTLTLGPVVALNLVLTLGAALSAWTAFLAIRRYVGRAIAAAAGGAVYGFSPFVVAHSSSHVVLGSAFMLPLIILALDEVFVRQRRAPLVMGMLLGCAAGVQFFISEEMLAIVAVAAVVGTLVLMVLNRSQVRARAPYALGALITAGLVFTLVAAYPLAVQLFGPQRPHGILQTAALYETDLMSPVLPTGLQLIEPGPGLWAVNRFTGSMENTTYLGLPLVGIVYWMARRQWALRTIRWASITLVILFVFSMGDFLDVAGVRTSMPLPWFVVSQIPPLGQILPVRIMALGFFLAALLLAVFLDLGLSSRVSKVRRSMLVASSLALLALLPRPLQVEPVMAPAFFTGPGVQRLPPGSVVLVAPFASAYTGSAAMGWQAQAGMRFRMPEGYMYGPNWLSPAPSRMQSAMQAIQLYADRPPLPPRYRTQLLDELGQWRVRTVIVGPMDNEDAMVDFITRLLGRPPVETDGVFLWWDVGDPRSVA